MKYNKISVVIIINLILVLLSIQNANAWWNDDWTFRKKINIDTTPVTGADIADSSVEIPLLVRLHTGNFGYFLDVKQGGADIRFIAGDDKTPLKFHLEKFDAINEMALIWVLLPGIKASSSLDNIWMYYGNANAVNAQDTKGSYDQNQVLVYHFKESDEISKDATAYQNNPSLFTVQSIATGMIGNGVRFKGNGIISIPTSLSTQIDSATGWTASMWVKIASPQNNAYLLHRHDEGQELILGVDEVTPYAELVVAGKSYKASGNSALSLGNWHHLALSINMGNLELYFDGVVVATIPIEMAPMTGDITLGTTKSGGLNYYIGDMDEVNFAKVSRSASWLKTLVASQSIDARLIKYGEDEQASGNSGSDSYFAVILQNVTIDGWVVIVLLVIMAVISWLVMLFKGITINRVSKQNNIFKQQFREIFGINKQVDDTDIQSIEDSFKDKSKYQESNLFQIFDTGLRELQHRLGKAVGAQSTGLSAQAIEAFRVSLDAVLVRETQKINAQMVLLTIAISGGPFLGLLGTVVGVMITFAAIAATGDVDINAIAPGIAAALVATVAGLVVAIPALFGYNYLGSKIQEIVADMHVFVDEFVAKTAEKYS